MATLRLWLSGAPTCTDSCDCRRERSVVSQRGTWKQLLQSPRLRATPADNPQPQHEEPLRTGPRWRCKRRVIRATVTRVRRSGRRSCTYRCHPTVLVLGGIVSRKLTRTRAPCRAFLLRGRYAMEANGHVIEPGADLRGADLSGVHIWFAKLSNGDLTGACLSKIDLSSTRLSGVTLRGTYIHCTASRPQRRRASG